MPSKGMVHGLLILSPYEKWPVLFLGGAIPNVLSAYAARANATSLSFAVMFCGTLPVNSLGVPIVRQSNPGRPRQLSWDDLLLYTMIDGGAAENRTPVLSVFIVGCQQLFLVRCG